MAAYGLAGVWTRRVMITVVCSAAVASADVDVTIPPDFDDFWDRIDSSGLELRVVSSDSRTKLSYSVDNGSGGAFDKSGRLGRIRIDAATMPNEICVAVLWLYYGSSSTQGTGAVATVMAAPINGYVELSVPAGRRFRYEPSTPNLTRPRTVLGAKRSAEAVYVWFDLTRAISRRFTPGSGSYTHEELYYAMIEILNSVSVAQAGMTDITKCRLVWMPQDGSTWMRIYVTSGASGSNYAVVPKVYTRIPGEPSWAQALQAVAGLPVRDVVLTS